MATPLSPSTSTSSFEESPEYTTMRECRVVLVDLLKSSISCLGDALFAKGLISEDIDDRLLSSHNPANKTREVVRCLTNRVKHNPSIYHEFIGILREQGPWTEDMVEKLTSCYESQTATPEPSTASLSESQSKLRLEFTVPPDVPHSVLTALESVQVSVLLEDQNKAKRSLLETPLRVERDDSSATPGSRGSQVPWLNEPDMAHGAAGGRDVLLLVPDTPTTNPDIVPRRTRDPLTELERRKLEEQGVHRDYHHSDLAIMTARYGLDKRITVAGMIPKNEMTCEEVKRQLTGLMNTTAKEGVVLYYIGPGKKGTGDWCFSDGFISFREIMDLYTQHLKGRVLTIVSDCNYSGAWVREGMTFLDEQGVGPCGHVAKDKEILLKVYASCQSNEIPAELAFSTHAVENRSTRIMTIDFLSKEIHDDQHPSGLNFTRVRCKNKIDEPCTMAPESTWEMWMTAPARRIFIVRGKDRGRPAWSYVKVEDNEDTCKAFHKAVKSGTVDIDDYGEVLKSGLGKDPPESVKKALVEQYDVNYFYNCT